MTNYVQFTNSTLGITKKVFCNNISYNFTNMVSDFPISGNFTGIQPVQFNGWNNPGINLQFELFLASSLNPSGYMTWDDWNKLTKATSTTTLTIQLTDDSTVIFTSYANSSSGLQPIPIQIKSWGVNIDPKTDYSNNTITINAQLLETSA